MAKQTFTTGQVLTAAQMTSLQQTAMGGGSATAKTTSYVLVAADAGTTVAMNAAGATTITVNTSLFSAGDTVLIQNLGAGTCTVTAGTATVNTPASLALAQYETGLLYFTSASASIFMKDAAASGSTYTSWTPTFTNITTGTGTKSGSYVKNGKFVSGYAKIVFGATTAITGTPILTLPSSPENGNISFTSIIADTGTATFNGFGELSGADFYCYVNNASGTYVNTSNISATVPMTWTTNDSLTISFNYKET